MFSDEFLPLRKLDFGKKSSRFSAQEISKIE